MDALTVKCRCRGTNGDCHMCFGTGDVLAASEYAAVPTYVAVPKHLSKSPSRQPFRPAQPPDIFQLFRRHAGLALAKDANAIVDAASLCQRKGVDEVQTFLARSLKCPKPLFARFVPTLASAIRTAANKHVNTLVYDVNIVLIEARVSARLTVDVLNSLAAAWQAQKQTSATERLISRHIEEKESGAHLPTGRELMPRPLLRSPSLSVVSALAEGDSSVQMGHKPERLAKIEHVLVLSSGAALPERLLQFSAFVERHRFKMLYAGTPKMIVRDLAKRFPDLKIAHVENAVNLAFIRNGKGVAVFDLDKAN